MLKNNIVAWNELIQFTSVGIVIASYTEIRDALTAKFKSIYGDDIDLSTGSADGIYVETLSLLINNILQGFKSFYSNLDPKTASGQYLDILCSLSNVTRKQATYSTASLTVTLSTTESSDYTTRSISFLDKDGVEWKYESPYEDITFVKGQEKSIIVTCTQSGPIRAPKGWIDRLLSSDVVMSVSQPEDANMGSYAESDAQLRSRRNQVLGVTGTSVLESLAGALLNLDGIDDVKIFNNNTTESMITNDSTSISPHCTYVVIRQNPAISIEDSTVGTIIYEKMTPGILTTAMSTSSSTGVNHTFKYYQYILGDAVTPEIAQNVNWKVATPVKPEIKIIIEPKENFASANNYTLNLIGKSVIEYANDLPLDTHLLIDDIKDEIDYADPLFRGRSTFRIQSVTIDGKTTDYFNQLTYYNYTSISFPTPATSGTYEIVLS